MKCSVLSNIEEIHSLVADTAEEKGAEMALIFGSLARGDASKRSDLDVIFVEDTSDGFIDRIGRYLSKLRDKKILKTLDIDVLVYTPNEFERMKTEKNRFLLRALKEGKIVYEHGKRQKQCKTVDQAGS